LSVKCLVIGLFKPKKGYTGASRTDGGEFYLPANTAFPTLLRAMLAIVAGFAGCTSAMLPSTSSGDSGATDYSEECEK